MSGDLRVSSPAPATAVGRDRTRARAWAWEGAPVSEGGHGGYKKNSVGQPVFPVTRAALQRHEADDPDVIGLHRVEHGVGEAVGERPPHR